jgi:hypothetical protein
MTIRAGCWHATPMGRAGRLDLSSYDRLSPLRTSCLATGSGISSAFRCRGSVAAGGPPSFWTRRTSSRTRINGSFRWDAESPNPPPGEGPGHRISGAARGDAGERLTCLALRGSRSWAGVPERRRSDHVDGSCKPHRFGIDRLVRTNLPAQAKGEQNIDSEPAVGGAPAYTLWADDMGACCPEITVPGERRPDVDLIGSRVLGS